MKTTSARNLVLVTLIVLTLIYVWYQHQEKKQLQQGIDRQNQRLQNLEASLRHTGRAFAAQIELVNELAKKVPNPDSTVLATANKLNELALQWVSIMPDVAQELTSAGNLLRAEETVKSIAAMANIVENLLKKWLKNDEEFQKRYAKKLDKQSVNFGNLIEYVSEKELFTEEEIFFLKEVKKIRNESAHELAVQKAKTYLLNCQERCVDFLKGILSRLHMVQNPSI